MTATTGIIQVIAITKTERSNYLGRHYGVKVKDIETREVFWFNYFAQNEKPLQIAGFYKMDFRTEAIIARVKRAAK